MCRRSDVPGVKVPRTSDGHSTKQKKLSKDPLENFSADQNQLISSPRISADILLQTQKWQIKISPENFSKKMYK